LLLLSPPDDVISRPMAAGKERNPEIEKEDRQSARARSNNVRLQHRHPRHIGRKFVGSKAPTRFGSDGQAAPDRLAVRPGRLSGRGARFSPRRTSLATMPQTLSSLSIGAAPAMQML